MEMETCLCGTDLAYEDCCEPLIKGTRTAITAEELMRSRYTAYAKTEVDYLLQTTHPSKREHYDERRVRNWSRNSEWQKLEIIETKSGGPDDDAGQVEFVAHYRVKGVKKHHHELAQFEKVDGQWYFEDGQAPKLAQYVRPGPKIGRNDPCPCGSGKKHKRCCGR
jgi:SEC-C motif-containing protein